MTLDQLKLPVKMSKGETMKTKKSLGWGRGTHHCGPPLRRSQEHGGSAVRAALAAKGASFSFDEVGPLRKETDPAAQNLELPPGWSPVLLVLLSGVPRIARSSSTDRPSTGSVASRSWAYHPPNIRFGCRPQSDQSVRSWTQRLHTFGVRGKRRRQKWRLPTNSHVSRSRIQLFIVSTG